MSFRDDHDAALARADALERELAIVKAENERLRRAPAAPLAPARPKPPLASRGAWLVGGALNAAGVAAMFAGSWALAIAGVLAVLSGVGMWAAATLTVTAGPDELVVLVGRTHRAPDGRVIAFRSLRDGRALRVPIVEQETRHDVSPLLASMELRGAFTRDGRQHDLKATARIGFPSAPVLRVSMIERFLGTTRDDIARVARETIEGHAREVLGRRTAAELADRAALADEIGAETEPDLAKLGLSLEELAIEAATPST